MPRLSLFLLLSLAFAVAHSAPTAPNLVYQLQAQLPPVARTNQAWSWTLLPGTFNASADSTLTLSTSDLPAWCDFDAASETFYGLPAFGDVGSTAVTVTANVSGIASGASGSFALLVVDSSAESAPYIRLPLDDQLASAAAVSGGGTLTPDGALKVPPQWSFSFGFQQYTFQNDQRQRIFYEAYEEGTTSLPSWMTFDNRTVTFGGLAPLQEGDHTIVLHGSERYGYGDVSQSFRIVVTEHSFELLGAAAAAEANVSSVLPVVAGTPGGPVNYTIPLDGFRIDNSSISVANLTGVDADFAAANLSSFLALDFPALTVTGDLPFSLAAGNHSVPLTFVDQYNSSLRTNLTLSISSSLFDPSFFPQTIDVQVGKEFSQPLSPFFASASSSSSSDSDASRLARRARSRRQSSPATPDATFSASITPAEAGQWLTFSPTDLTLSGTAPADIPSYANATVEILATPLSGAASRAEFVFAVVSSSTNTTLHPTPPSSPSSHSGLSHSAQLGLGLGLGLGGGLVLLALLAFCCWKKRKGGAGENREENEADRKLRRDTSQQLAGYSPNPATDASTITVVTPHTPGMGDYADGEGEEEKFAREQEKLGAAYAVGLPPPVPGSEKMALPLHQQQQQQQQGVAAGGAAGPKRFDVMGMLFRSESGWSVKSAFSRKGKGKQPASSSAAAAATAGVRKEDVSYPRPALPQESSLFGLGIDDDEDEHNAGHQHAAHQVVIVSGAEDGVDGRRATTYRENSDPAALARAQTPSSSNGSGGPRAPGRVSSWESGGSSSLFYSDRSAASPAPSSPHSNATGSPASSGRRRANRPPSIPYRRRDFLPLPLKSPTASDSSPVPSPTRETYDAPGASFYRHNDPAETSIEREESGGSGSGSAGGAGGIRMVGSHSDSTGSDPYASRPSGLGDETAQSMPHVASFQQYSSPSRSGSYPSDSPSSDSLPAPRLIPFTSERTPAPFSRTLTSQSSLRARDAGAVDPEAVEDALDDETSFGDDPDADGGEWEYDEGPSGVSAVSSARRRTGIRPASGVYHGEGEPETSVVYYGPEGGAEDTSADYSNPRETWRSPSGFADSIYSYEERSGGDDGEEGGVRYVGSVASTSVAPSPYLRDAGYSARGREMDRASGSYYGETTPRSDVFSHHSTATTAPTPTSAAFRHSQASSASRHGPQHKRQPSHHDPIRVPLSVNVPFRFTPRLTSPPFVSITSSPGRGGPPRATYHAFLELDGEEEDEDEDPLADLPDWLHFDGASMEMFGLARRNDVGSWRVVVLERKVMRTPGRGSPTRQDGRASPDKEWEDVTEMVVGRFEMVVGFRDGAEEEDVREDGELRIVTY
ncbi:hypothetical protein JCM6882_006980 [Rhodosporidiobolus microsporus]